MGRTTYYNKFERELVYIINVDGSVHSKADAYDSKLCRGNIFKDSLRDMQKSDGYLRAVNAAHSSRMERTCRACRFHGVCSGYYMGEATPEQRWLDETGRPICGVAQPIQDYIERLLIDAGFVDSKLHSLVRNRITERIR